METPNSFIYSFIVSESDQGNQEQWSKHDIKMALAILGVPTYFSEMLGKQSILVPSQGAVRILTQR